MGLNIRVTLFLAVFASVVHRTTTTYIWPLMWSAPHPQPHDSNVFEDLQIPHPRNVLYRRLSKNSTQNDSTEFMVQCDSDKSCGKGFYCDLHYGDCRVHKTPGEACRRDGHCGKGLDCMFGTCQFTVEPFSLGARCRGDKDCVPRHCCARQHGESICKAKLPVNAKCYVPEGGVDYVIDSICPCDQGLLCQLSRHHRRNTEPDSILRFWTDFSHMRCQAV